ncbi:uncharacterized protein J3D65DRAFT_605939 [Phyllosticta citribraziliensis]|uniref:F-box domain-containing protein n=1 Tax=Phyllosticta citribraziliensis TaxID=989973 RepID=A0ABR1LBF6_9PEZI
MSSHSAPTISEVPARQQHPFRLLDLPDVILKVVIDQVVECDIEEATATDYTFPLPVRALMSLSQVNKSLRSLIKGRIFRTVFLLKRQGGDRTYRDVQQRFSPLAQGRPYAISEEVMNIFCRPPVHLFAGTSSLAIHQFWTRGYLSDVWISNGIIKLLQAPRSLRRLHIDGDTKLANYMEDAMEVLPPIDFSTLTEVTISIEMTFLLKYMPNIQRLSNKAFSGVEQDPRIYPMSHVREFLDACRNRQKLKTLELTVADFDPYRRRDFHDPAMFRIPNLSLETLAITGEAPRSMSDTIDEDQLHMPLGGIINMALSQKGLVELQIPWLGSLTLGLGANDAWEEEGDPADRQFALVDIVPAAIIAAKVPNLQRIKIRRDSMVEILRGENKMVLKLTDVPVADWSTERPASWFEQWDHWKEPLVNRQKVYNRAEEEVVLPLHVVHEGPDVHPARFITDEDHRPTRIEVNVDNPRIDAVEYL